MELSPIGEEIELKKKLLREATIWMYNTPYTENPSEDKGDEKKTSNFEVTRRQWEEDPKPGGGYAKGKWPDNIWIFTGYFNTLLKPPTMDGTPKIKRKITIDDEDKIFIVVASSHASDIWEQARLKKRGIEKSLLDIARSTQVVYQKIKLTIDGIVTELELVEEDGIPIKIPLADQNARPVARDHPAVSYYTGLPIRPGDQAIMASVAHTRMITSLAPGIHYIDLYATSPGDEPTGDIQYEIDVRYEVTVTG